jgi:hypothetical protein
MTVEAAHRAALVFSGMSWHWSILGLAWTALFAGALAHPAHPPTDAERTGEPAALRYRVLAPDAEPLLGFLAQRLAPTDDFRVGERSCRSSIVDARTENLWFDDDAMSLLGSGVEARLVRTVPIAGQSQSDRIELEKGEASVRLETGIDASAPTRLESSLRLSDLFLPASRDESERSIRGTGVDPTQLRLALKVERRAHGIALSDASGERFSITVVRIVSRQDDLALQWHELEAIVPASQREDRDAFLEFRTALLAELTAACPRLVRDDAADYPRTFERLQRATWLPLRLLHSLRVSDLEAKIALLLCCSTLCATAAAAIAIRRLRRRRTAVSPRA